MGLKFIQSLVGESEQLMRHSEPEGFRGLEVDHKLKFDRLLDRQVRHQSLCPSGCLAFVLFVFVLVIIVIVGISRRCRVSRDGNYLVDARLMSAARARKG